jgi:hypothetical protein
MPAPAGAETLPDGYTPHPGEVVVNPQIDCNSDPVHNTTGLAGITVDGSDVTIINPSIRECSIGILVRKNSSGVMPTNVRIIADANYPGYQQTNLTLNRAGIKWQTGNGEVGDVSALNDSVGGEFKFVDNYRAFSGTFTTGFRLHHTSSTCNLPCPTYSGADSPGMHFDLKFLYDRTSGYPHEASNVRFDHNFVQGFDDEGISFDTHGADPDKRMGYAASSVGDKTAKTLQLANVPTTSSTIGMWVVFNEGQARGRSVQITARNGSSFTVADPDNWLSKVDVGDRVSVGGRFYNERIDHNRLDLFYATAAKSGINNAGMNYSVIEDNVLFDTPDFPFKDAFHLRTDHQCVLQRSTAGPGGVPAFAFFNSIRDNTCKDAGDISSVVVSWGAYEVRSPTCIGGNSFVGSPRGSVWRYKAPQPRRGMRGCRPGRR